VRDRATAAGPRPAPRRDRDRGASRVRVAHTSPQYVGAEGRRVLMGKLAVDKPPTVAVTRFLCGSCGGICDTHILAEIHCTCKCGRPVSAETRAAFLSDRCDLCTCRDAVAHQRKRVRQLKKELRAAEDHLIVLEEDLKARD
jgi:hypothetical protein